ncbi:MAG: hypothetical protein ACRD0P_29435 [Stackebrandtia sp.]
MEPHLRVRRGGALQEWLWDVAQVQIEEGGDVAAGDLDGAGGRQSRSGQADVVGDDGEIDEAEVIRAAHGQPAPPSVQAVPQLAPRFVVAAG